MSEIRDDLRERIAQALVDRRRNGKPGNMTEQAYCEWLADAVLAALSAPKEG